LPYGLLIAEHGLEEACKNDKALAKGVNLYQGMITYKEVANTFNMPYTNIDQLI
jgi:alanine dehydrogenase